MASIVQAAAYGALSKVLRLLIRLIAPWAPQLRGPLHYLDSLLAQRRYGEFNALVAQGARNLSRRVRPGSGGAGRDERQPRLGGVEIDAPTQRLSDEGKIVQKQVTCRFPDGGAEVLVSIVIPAFNGGKYLSAAIASARAQTLSSREIILVDDGSTDEAIRSVLKSLGQEPDLKIVRQARQGVAAACNSGIGRARGEFVLCLAADDLIEPTYLECAVSRLLADRAAGFVYPYLRCFGDVDEVQLTEDFDIDRAMLGNFNLVSAVFRRDDWQEIGGFAADGGRGLEDAEFWIRVASLGRRGRVIRRPLVARRRHGPAVPRKAQDEQEFQARLRERNPRVFGEPDFRRMLKLIMQPQRRDPKPLGKLRDAVATGSKPGLLVVVPWLRRGGAEVLLLSLLKTLTERWHIVLATTEDDPHAMHDDYAAVVPEIFHLHQTFPAAEREAFLVHLIETRAVTHCLSSQSSWVLQQLPALKAAFPRLKTANILHNHVPDRVFRAALAAGEALDLHFAVSSLVTASLGASGVKEGKIRQIANGIDIEPCARVAEQRREIRAELGLGDEDRLLLWAGRFADEKRPGVFVDVVAALAADPKLHAIMAGEGPLEASVDAAIRDAGLAGRIRRPGHVSRAEVARLMAAADMLVVTSSVEGMPLTVLEALATGCPVASVKVGDVAEVVKPGLNGALAEPSRPQDLAPAIRASWDTLAGETARAAIRAGFAQTANTEAAMGRAYLETLAAI